MSEWLKKVSLAEIFLLLVDCISPASAFWHQGQSGTAGRGLIRHYPARKNTYPCYILHQYDKSCAGLNNTMYFPLYLLFLFFDA